MLRLKKQMRSVLIILHMATLVACGTAPVAVTKTDTKAAASTTALNAAITPASADTSTAPAKDTQEAASRDTYIIQPGDVLTISVWREKDLQGEYTIRPDGGLNFPLAGEIIAAGKTIEQLKLDIVARLIKYVPDPVVTITVKQAQGNKIYVVGKVNKPGDFFVNRNVDVMQALSMAGGPTPYASVNKIKILRRINGEQKTFMFRYADVEKGKNLEQNIILLGGDIVVVP